MKVITNGGLRIEVERLCDENEHLREENAKLRELLSQALAAHELDTFFEYFEPHSFWVGWCKDVHEMGIEVDG